MPEFVTLTCPSCGGKLDITPDIDRFACAHCGHEHIVKRGGGLISLTPVVDAIKTIGVGVDKTAAELALVRLDKEIEQTQESKRKVISSTPSPEKSNLAVFLILLPLLLIPYSIARIIGSDPNLVAGLIGLVIGLLCVIIAIVMLRSYSKRYIRWEASLQEKTAPLDAAITQKEQERATYLRVVQSKSSNDHH